MTAKRTKRMRGNYKRKTNDTHRNHADMSLNIFFSSFFAIQRHLCVSKCQNKKPILVGRCIFVLCEQFLVSCVAHQTKRNVYIISGDGPVDEQKNKQTQAATEEVVPIFSNMEMKMRYFNNNRWATLQECNYPMITINSNKKKEMFSQNYCLYSIHFDSSILIKKLNLLRSSFKGVGWTKGEAEKEELNKQTDTFPIPIFRSYQNLC